jgi:dTDP-4-dehydrorhamnose reductase
MRMLLLGKNGQVGWELQRTLVPIGEVFAFDAQDFDLTDVQALRQTVRRIAPDVIVNAAAYTAVDKAESEPDLAMAVNVTAPAIMSEEMEAQKGFLIHFSTDFVFDGKKGSPYTEEDRPNPLSRYGETKLKGELAIQERSNRYMIFRTSWVYSLNRDSFVTKVLNWSRQQKSLRIVTDQVSNPTWCRLLAEVTAQVLAMSVQNGNPWLQERSGLYHVANTGFASRLEWARATLKHDPHPETCRTEQILPATTSEFPTAAVRPSFSALNCERFQQTFGLHLPNWEESLQMALAD